jgi:tRNA A-37 threonylcarbamoyl transferase component Bud32
VKQERVRWYVRAPYFKSTLQRIVQEPDAVLSDPKLHYKDYALATIARVPAVAVDERALVMRRLNYGRIIHRLRDLFRSSRARRAFNNGLRLERAAVDTPRMVAVGEWRRLGWPMKAYVITEEVPGAMSIGRFFKQKKSLPRRVVYALANLIARLHNAGFSHRDLKGTNILLDNELTPWLIDLDGVRHFRQIPTRRAVRDLAVLARSFRAKAVLLRWSGARFLKRYCRRRGIEREFRKFASLLMRELEGE